MRTIFTIDAIDNIMLEVISSYFDLSHSQIFKEINEALNKTIDILKMKGIDYADLKNCLIPRLDRKEIILVFDTQQIDSGWYGYEVFKKVIPLFNKDSTLSVLIGDFSDRINNQQFLYDRFFESLNQINTFKYKHSSQFFFVYINNLSIDMINHFNEGLKV